MGCCNVIAVVVSVNDRPEDVAYPVSARDGLPRGCTRYTAQQERLASASKTCHRDRSSPYRRRAATS